MERRIIAIQMLPKAYDEIQRLKGDETWTRFIIQCVMHLPGEGDNHILKDELASLTKEPKAEKPKTKKGKTKKAETEVPSAEEAERVGVEGKGTLIMPHTHRSKKAKVQEPSAEVTGERQPTENELKAEVPTGEREESMGIGTPVNKGEG